MQQHFLGNSVSNCYAFLMVASPQIPLLNPGASVMVLGGGAAGR